MSKLCAFGLVAVVIIAVVGTAFWVAKKVSNRDPNLFYDYIDHKALKCPRNEFLNNTNKACEPTCEKPIRSDSCSEKNVSVCVCYDGDVRSLGGICIKPILCPVDDIDSVIDFLVNMLKSLRETTTYESSKGIINKNTTVPENNANNNSSGNAELPGNGEDLKNSNESDTIYTTLRVKNSTIPLTTDDNQIEN